MAELKQVLWSGGLDSTYLIYKLLQDGFQVEAYYVEVKNNSKKTAREKAAIAKLTPLLEKYNFKYKGIILAVDVDINVQEKLSFGLLQVPIWILACCYLNGPVSIGYVMNDDAISYLNDFQNSVAIFNQFRRTAFVVEFPLSKVKKDDIINLLPADLYKHVTYCDSETQKTQCGKCLPCRRHKNVVTQMKKSKNK